MLLRVTQYGEPVLREKGKPVVNFDDKLITLADNMLETMYANNGVGIAAQQVGEALQFCVIDLQVRQKQVDFFYELDGKRPPLNLIMPMALANPVISVETTEEEGMEEGCLSFPEIRGDVYRPTRITVRYQDLKGAFRTLTCDGFFARVIQHEYDHLQGTLFIDRMSDASLKEIEGQIKTLKKKTRDFLAKQGKKPKYN